MFPPPPSNITSILDSRIASPPHCPPVHLYRNGVGPGGLVLSSGIQRFVVFDVFFHLHLSWYHDLWVNFLRHNDLIPCLTCLCSGIKWDAKIHDGTLVQFMIFMWFISFKSQWILKFSCREVLVTHWHFVRRKIPVCYMIYSPAVPLEYPWEISQEGSKHHSLLPFGHFYSSDRTHP